MYFNKLGLTTREDAGVLLRPGRRWFEKAQNTTPPHRNCRAKGSNFDKFGWGEWEREDQTWVFSY